jgi:phage N-6-adenine-methyltransferase
VSASRTRACACGCRRRFRAASTGRPRRFYEDACRVKAWRRRNRSREVMHSSRTDEWSTDPAVFARLDAELGPFDLDPCATDENAKCARYFTRADDGLAREWTGRVFLNPPYGRTLPAWMAKAYEAAQTTADLVVCLVPARTDTRWWHDYAARGDIRLLRGRLRFGGCPNAAPFPSAVVTFRNARAVTKPELVEMAA